jgi:hypothetical protein
VSVTQEDRQSGDRNCLRTRILVLRNKPDTCSFLIKVAIYGSSTCPREHICATAKGNKIINTCHTLRKHLSLSQDVTHTQRKAPAHNDTDFACERHCIIPAGNCYEVSYPATINQVGNQLRVHDSRDPMIRSQGFSNHHHPEITLSNKSHRHIYYISLTAGNSCYY